MKVLVVGAGAVGQVYGRHLQQGGADVTFFVREKYAATVREGFVLYALNARRPTEPVRWRDYGVVTTTAEVGATTWDYVLLTVSSAALQGPWLGELLGASGAAHVVMLQPGMDDRARVAAHVADERIVSGLITLISYAAPLPGETRFPEPGMAYWFPPLSPAPFSGSRAARGAIDRFVTTLRRGGQPATRGGDVPSLVAFPTAIMMPWLVALEAAGWTFAAVARSPLAQLGADGAKEALAIVARTTGRWVGVFRVGAWRWLIFVAMWLGKRVVPLPLETYLREHFIKVGDQTRLFMARYIELGREAGQPTRALEALQQRLLVTP